MPKISVIITSYNVENYIANCLDSVVSQTLDDIEVFCIDDCSTDNTYKILKEYELKDKRITILKNDKHYGGPSVGLNKGIELSKGEYLYFIDSDDSIDTNFLQELYSSAKKYEVYIVSTLCLVEKYIDEKNDEISEIKFNSSYKIEEWKNEYDDGYLEGKSNICIKDFFVDNKESLLVVVWNKIFRRSFIENNNIKFMPIIDGIEGGSNDIYFVYKAVLNKPTTAYNHKAMHFRNMRSDSLYHSIKYNPLMITAAIKRMVNLIEYCMEYFLEDIQYLKPLLWNTTYKRYSIIENKEIIYQYMHEFVLYLDIELCHNEYYLIKIIDNYKDYYILSSIIKEKDYIIEEKNNIIKNNRDNAIRTWFNLCGIYNTKNYLIIIIFGIKISFKMNKKRINKIAKYIPFKKLKNYFINKFIF